MRVLALCGVVAPILFWAAVGGAAALRPGYDQLRDAISDLATGPHAELMNAALVAYGILTAVFARGLRRGLPPHRSARFGADLLAVSGIGVAGLGLEWFAGLPAPLFRPLHDALAITAYVCGTAACLATAEGLRGDARWAGIARFSRACGILGAGLIGSSVLAASGAHYAFAAIGVGDGNLAPIAGGLQRVLTADLQLWVAVLGLRFLGRDEARVSELAA